MILSFIFTDFFLSASSPPNVRIFASLWLFFFHSFLLCTLFLSISPPVFIGLSPSFFLFYFYLIFFFISLISFPHFFVKSSFFKENRNNEGKIHEDRQRKKITQTKNNPRITEKEKKNRKKAEFKSLLRNCRRGFKVILTFQLENFKVM